MHNLTLIDGAPGDAMVERAMRFKPGKDLGSVFMKKFARCGFFVCALLSAWCTDALAVIININANTNWSAIATGSGVGGQPNSTDNIIVLRGATLTVDVGNGQCASIQLGRDTGGVGQRGNGTLLFNAASQVTVSGIVTLGDNTNGGNRTGSITMTAGGTLILTGFTVNVFGAWTPGNGTVELSATNTLPTQLNASGYNNLTVNGAGTTTSLSGTVTVAGALNVAAGTLAVGANTLNVGRNFTVNGTLSDTGPVNLTGSGTTIDGTGSVTDTGTVTFAGTIVISGAITVTNNGTITSTAAGGITGSVAGSTWTNAANSTLNVSGPLLATGTLTASANPNTVNYAGAAQTVRLPSAGTYFHLTLSGSGSKTMPARRLNIIRVRPIDSRLRWTQSNSRNSRHAAWESIFFFAAGPPAAAAIDRPPAERSALRILGAPERIRAMVRTGRSCVGACGSQLSA